MVMFSDFKLLEFLLCNIACKFKTKPTCFSVQESAVVTDTFDFNYFSLQFPMLLIRKTINISFEISTHELAHCFLGRKTFFFIEAAVFTKFVQTCCVIWDKSVERKSTTQHQNIWWIPVLDRSRDKNDRDPLPVIIIFCKKIGWYNSYGVDVPLRTPRSSTGFVTQNLT